MGARKTGRRKAKPAESTAQRLQRSKKAAILKSIAKGATKEAAAGAAGVNRSTLWRWEQEDEAFAEALFNLQQKCISVVEGVLFKQAQKPEGRIDRLFYLKTRAGYVERGLERSIELRAGYYEAAMRRQAPPEEEDEPAEFQYVITSRAEHKEPDIDDGDDR